MFTGLDFTTLARVRTVLAFADNDTNRDPELSRLIRIVSDQMEGELRRYAKVDEYVETLPVWPSSRILSLQGFPVLDSPAPIVLGSNYRDFDTSPTAMLRGQDYVLENETGRIRFLGEVRGVTDRVSGWAVGPTYFQVTYTGGLAETTAGLGVAYPQLSGAAELQVTYAWKRATSPGGNTMLGPNSTAFERPLDLLPSVKRTLDYFKRRSIH